MVLAAGLGTRLRPLTNDITKPMVPVLDRPVMEHILDLLGRHGFEHVIANLHYFPDTIRDYFGDRISYRYEQELLGTAGGVRACADFFGDSCFGSFGFCSSAICFTHFRCLWQVWDSGCR